MFTCPRPKRQRKVRIASVCTKSCSSGRWSEAKRHRLFSCKVPVSMLSPVAAIAVLATEVCSASSKSVSPTPIGRRCKLTRIQQLLRQNPLFLSSPETQEKLSCCSPRRSAAKRRKSPAKGGKSLDFSKLRRDAGRRRFFPIASHMWNTGLAHSIRVSLTRSQGRRAQRRPNRSRTSSLASFSLF